MEQYLQGWYCSMGGEAARLRLVLPSAKLAVSSSSSGSGAVGTIISPFKKAFLRKMAGVRARYGARRVSAEARRDARGASLLISYVLLASVHGSVLYTLHAWSRRRAAARTDAHALRRALARNVPIYSERYRLTGT